METLRSVARRLDMLSNVQGSTPKDYGKSCVRQLESMYEISCKVGSALEEVSTGIQALGQANASIAIPGIVSAGLQTLTETVRSSRSEMQILVRDVRLSEYPIVLPSKSLSYSLRTSSLIDLRRRASHHPKHG